MKRAATQNSKITQKSTVKYFFCSAITAVSQVLTKKMSLDISC